VVARIGRTVNASSQEDSSAMVTTTKIFPMISPITDSARKKERKAADVVSVETNRGAMSSREDCTAADAAASPACIFTMIDSLITMALSTSIPRAMISEARVTLFRPISIRDMIRRVTMMVDGIRLATTRPVRRPRKISITSNTTPTACIRLPIKSFTDLSTSVSW